MRGKTSCVGQLLKRSLNLGYDPTVIKPALGIAWVVVENALADSPGKNIWLAFVPHLMANAPSDDDDLWFYCILVTDLPAFAAALGTMPHFNPRRLGLIDVSRLRRELDQSLEQSSD